MLAQVKSAALRGIDAFPVAVEVDVSFGLPLFAMVGLPDASVRESRDRVRAAIRLGAHSLGATPRRRRHGSAPAPLVICAANAIASGPTWTCAAPSASEVCSGCRPCTGRLARTPYWAPALRPGGCGFAFGVFREKGAAWRLPPRSASSSVRRSRPISASTCSSCARSEACSRVRASRSSRTACASCGVTHPTAPNPEACVQPPVRIPSVYAAWMAANTCLRFQAQAQLSPGCVR